MFRLNSRFALPTATPDRTRYLLRRALLFGGGLALLWLALQLAPSPSPVEASPPVAEMPATPQPAAPRLFSTGTVAALVLLAGGIGLAFFLRRRSREGGAAAVPLQSIGQMTLAPNQHLRLVRCGDDVLLLGVTSGQIALLKQYPGDAFDAALEPSEDAVSATAQPSAPPSFSTLLRQQVGLIPTVQQT